MENFLTFLRLALSDEFVFILLQILILFVLVYGGVVGRRRVKGYHVPRSLEPKHVFFSYSLLSAAAVQSLGAVDLFSGSKLILIIANLTAIFYLCFFNPWFRTLVARVMVKTKLTGKSISN